MHPPPPSSLGEGVKNFRKVFAGGGELGQKILFDEGEGGGGVT